MSIEIIGLLYHQLMSRTQELAHVDFDLEALRSFARVHEESGYDCVLVSQSAAIPDPLMISCYVAAETTKLGFLVAHRPGFIAPSLAARMFATLDRLSRGRAIVHVISGAQDSEMLRDGDRLNKQQRYQRSREYVQIMRRMWGAETPFDWDGDFYKLRQAFCEIKPPVPLEISWAGVSPAAFETAGECADVYAMVGDTPETAREYISIARVEAAKHGRTLAFTITLCVILGDTEEEAWRKARGVLAKVEAQMAGRPQADPSKLESAAFKRMLENSLKSDVVGRNLWMALNRVSGGAGNNTTIVGTVEQVTQTILDYYDIGIARFLLRGFEPLEDAQEFGRELIPNLRAAVSRRRPAAVKAGASLS